MDDREELDDNLIRRLRELSERHDDKGYLDVLNRALSKVRTVDNGEPLLPLNRTTLGKRISIDLVDLGVSHRAEERLQLRRSVVAMLRTASESLPAAHSLIVRDAFRSEKIVWDLYCVHMARVQDQQPNLSDKERDFRVRNLLAMPDDIVPPGHMTGGAVDVVLGDESGKRVNVEVDPKLIPRSEQAVTLCPNLPPEIVEKRMLLLRSLTAQGFHNYFREYWHFSYGDAYWAVRRNNKVAIYGIPQGS